jgi:hypothetical protein
MLLVSVTAKSFTDLVAREMHWTFARQEMKSDQIEQSDVRYHVLAYLCDNPNAGDTFDGIVEWWLLHQRIKFEIRNISEAVRKLVAEGLVVEDEGFDSRVTYRVNQDRGQDVQTIVNQAGGFGNKRS